MNNNDNLEEHFWDLWEKRKTNVFQVCQGCYGSYSCSSRFILFILGGRRRQKLTTPLVGGESCLRRLRKQDLTQFVVCISNFRFCTLIYAFRLCNCKWMKLFFEILYLSNHFFQQMLARNSMSEKLAEDIDTSVHTIINTS